MKWLDFEELIPNPSLSISLESMLKVGIFKFVQIQLENQPIHIWSLPNVNVWYTTREDEKYSEISQLLALPPDVGQLTIIKLSFEMLSVDAATSALLTCVCVDEIFETN